MRILVLALAFIAMPVAAQGDKRKTKGAVKQENMGRLSCEEQKRAYHASQACFARYRDPRTGKLHGKAHANCQELREPQC